jgi:bacillithiol biosynthesis cysteine-adding enzyme BshC
MGCQTIPPSRLPHQTKLLLDYLEKFQNVTQFYAHEPTLASAVRMARELKFPAERRSVVAGILRKQNAQWGGAAGVERNLERLANGAVAVVSGQQVGLFSGPAYSVYKALTAVQVAAELTAAGIDAVPVFWMATEDHDLAEVRRSTWFNGGKLQTFELSEQEGAAAPVGKIALGPQVNAMAQAAAAELLQAPDSNSVGAMLRESYKSGESYGSAFAKLFARLFAGRGLILLDPLDAHLHRVAAPIYKQALEQRDEINQALLSRGKDLERNGYDAQVKVTSRSTLLFRMDEHSRQVVNVNGDGTKFSSGNVTWPRAELIKFAESEPESFSPNALFRPVVQDYLLPTVAYIAGPSEIAYYAQSEVVYRHLLGRMPVILPRADFTLVDPKAERLLKSYGITVEQVWQGPQKFRQRIEAANLPRTVLREFERNKTQIEKSLAKMTALIEQLDPTLRGALENSGKKMTFQLEKLRRKTGKALDRKTGLMAEHTEFLESQLFPNKQLQSRELCFLPFLSRWGTAGLDELQKLSTTKSIGKHHIVSIP